MNWQQFNWADYVVVGIILFSTLVSFVRGFLREALSLTIWIAALWLAYRFSSVVATNFLSSMSSNFRTPLAFVIIFLGVLIAGAILNFFIGGVVYKTGLSGMDRMLGLVFGLARGILLIGVLILAAEMTAIPEDSWWQESQMIPQFESLVVWMRSILPKELEQLEKNPEAAALKVTGTGSGKDTTLRNKARIEEITQGTGTVSAPSSAVSAASADRSQPLTSTAE